MRTTGITRRDLLRSGAAARARAGLARPLTPAEVLERALATPAKQLSGTPECTPLSAIEHVVIFINENRSFDSYFGTYSGVKGFSDTNALPLNDGSGKNIF